MSIRTAVILATGLATVASAQIAKGATKFLGNITTNGALRSDFFTYWNQLTPENETKWGSVESSPGVRNWTQVKAYRDSCKKHGAPFKFHTFVWGSQEPSFMKSSSYTDAQKKQFIEDWIADAAKQFPDLELIDVVNEPDNTKPTWISALGGTGTTGHDWVIESFRLARKYFPKAKLILNDYNNFRWNVDNFIAIAKKVKAAGYLDAIGCQAHDLSATTGTYTNPTMTAADLTTVLKKLNDQVGVPIYVTELDLSYQDDAEQLAAYKSLFPVLWESKYVAAVTVWGYVYGSTWDQAKYSGLIKPDGTERPAMAWLKTYIAANPNPPGPVFTTGIAPTKAQAGIAPSRLELVQQGGHLGLKVKGMGISPTDLQGRI
jgi:endo-1,4-beta-xylanase